MICIHRYKTLYSQKANFNWVSYDQIQIYHNCQSSSTFQLSIEKPNPKWWQLPIRKKVTMIISQWEHRVETGNLLKARENASDQVVFGFSFTFDWLRLWHEFFGPITQRSEAKPKQSSITFDTQLETALIKEI